MEFIYVLSKFNHLLTLALLARVGGDELGRSALNNPRLDKCYIITIFI